MVNSYVPVWSRTHGPWKCCCCGYNSNEISAFFPSNKVLKLCECVCVKVALEEHDLSTSFTSFLISLVKTKGKGRWEGNPQKERYKNNEK